MPMINAGKYNHRIAIYQTEIIKDAQGFQTVSLVEPPVLEPYANVKTTRGMTLIANDTSFEKAYTNFTIRFPQTQITRDMRIVFRGKTYTIDYLNNVDEACVELEIQAKEVTH
jgi:SPP1 family predicted phage head-tail adaptor